MNKTVVGSAMFLYAVVGVLQVILLSVVAVALHSVTAFMAIDLALASLALVPVILLIVGSTVGGVDPLLLIASLVMLMGAIMNVGSALVEYIHAALHAGLMPLPPVYSITASIMFLAGWLLTSAFLVTRIRGALAAVAAVLLVMGYAIGLVPVVALSVVRPGVGLIHVIGVIGMTGAAFKVAGQFAGGVAVILRT